MITQAILSGAGAALSGLMTYLNNKKAKQNQDAAAASSISEAEARAAANPLDSSANQAMIAEKERMNDEQRRSSHAMNAIQGKAPEADLATEKAIADSDASMLTGMAASGSAKADQWAQRAYEAKRAAEKAEADRLAQRNETAAAISQSSAQLLGSMVPEGKNWNQELTDLETAWGSGNSGLTEEQYNAAKSKINSHIANQNQRRWG